ncbi:type VII secretion-associated serine protease mycosin [Planomonospora alba]|uniref:Type VII secretion-associated serine protease mycosin n=1 Tax=Planomonospora alba TaxID=161354 RepID=A0ABP6P5A3_9ACTN
MVLAVLAGASPARAAGPSRAGAGWESTAMRLPQAHQLSRGAGVTVAVLDTGVAAGHPALRGKVTEGPAFVGSRLAEDSEHRGRHGTAMAHGVLIAAPEAEILSVQVILEDEDPGKKEPVKAGPNGLNPLAEGIRYAVDHGAKVISMSLGTEPSAVVDYFSDEATAVAYAVNRGVTVIASAGNEGGRDSFNETSFPAGYPGVISVAAVGRDGRRAEFSTVKAVNTVAAPGVGIVSARNTGGYQAVNGTSPAGALAAGVAALLLSRNPELTPGQVRHVLTRTARHPAGGWNAEVGYGLIDAARAVTAARFPRAEPVTPRRHDGKEHLATPDGSSPVTGPELDTDYLVIGGGAGGVGLLALFGAVLLWRSGRPRALQAPAPALPVPGHLGYPPAPPVPGRSGCPPYPGHHGPSPPPGAAPYRPWD